MFYRIIFYIRVFDYWVLDDYFFFIVESKLLNLFFFINVRNSVKKNNIK